MDLDNVDIEGVLKLLQEVAAQYPEGSPHNKAVETAAHALFFVRVDSARKRFAAYLKNMDRPCSEFQRLQLEMNRILYGDEAEGAEKPKGGENE